jgi:heat-inducible transcriptional repressor
MSLKSQLNERHQNILKATVQHYIATAEPVGSKTLVNEYDFSISSATIRNVMGSLEKAGFLYQPHTSAGRIPSDSGYRIYVDQLITPDENMGKKIEQSLNNYFHRDPWNLEDLLQRATQMLATLSGYIALITMPQPSQNILKHLQLVQVNTEQIMLIVVTDTYQTQSFLIDINNFFLKEEKLIAENFEEELQILSNFLNRKLKGRSLFELSNLDWSELDQEFKKYAMFLKKLLKQLQNHAQLCASKNIVIKGISEVLKQPEFCQVDQVKMLLNLLEEKQDYLFPLIFKFPFS